MKPKRWPMQWAVEASSHQVSCFLFLLQSSGGWRPRSTAREQTPRSMGADVSNFHSSRLHVPRAPRTERLLRNRSAHTSSFQITVGLHVLSNHYLIHLKSDIISALIIKR